jgi:heme/copper-type cytochrome/quinol oxidase subunit 1
MLPAKLFAVLAVVFAVCVSIGRARALPALDIYLHGTYVILPVGHLFWFSSVLCACFAALYYATTRYLDAGWNLVLGVLHFSLVVLTAILFFMAAGSAHLLENGVSQPAIHRVFIPGFLGVLSFLFSWAIFAVNLVWTAVRAMRRRNANH